MKLDEKTKLLSEGDCVKKETRMTKGEYCQIKGLNVMCNPGFNPNDELTDDFKKQTDILVDNFMDIYNDPEDDADI